jgi:hypothetical protein
VFPGLPAKFWLRILAANAGLGFSTYLTSHEKISRSKISTPKIRMAQSFATTYKEGSDIIRQGSQHIKVKPAIH